MAEHASKEPTMEEILSTIRRIISEDGDTPNTPLSPGPTPASVLDAVQEAVAAPAEMDDADARQDADDFFDALEDLDDSLEFGEPTTQTEETLSFDDFASSVADTESTDDLRFEDLLQETAGFEEASAFEATTEITPAETIEDASEAFADDFEEIETLNDDFDSEIEAPVEEAETAYVAEPEPAPVTPAFTAPEKGPEDAMPLPQTVAEIDTPLMAQESANAAASSLAKLISNVDMTSEHNLDSMVRQMLQPMIKAWLDENLPEIVERKVQAEVERIANMVR